MQVYQLLLIGGGGGKSFKDQQDYSQEMCKINQKSPLSLVPESLSIMQAARTAP